MYINPLFVLTFLFIAQMDALPSIQKEIDIENDINGLDDDFIIDLSHLGENLYKGPSKETGDRVAKWTEESGVNPEELGDYAEGDIVSVMGMGRNGLAARSFRWPGGVIPYMISPIFSKDQQNLILTAMKQFHEHTCIRFVPRTGEQDYVRITAGTYGCQSMVGYTAGPQNVNLQIPGCVTMIGTVIHELMHTVGFLHEQSREDRDEYVAIQWNNVKSGYSDNFGKAASGSTNDFNVKYDYESVMHYSYKSFSANGQPTIVATKNGEATYKMGQRKGFSKSDIAKINKMYKCELSDADRQVLTTQEKDKISKYQCYFLFFCKEE